MKAVKQWMGWQRADGTKGIRNHTLVVYLVECARHVSEKIALPFESEGAQVIGFTGCYPNEYSHKMLQRLCAHPNVGAVLLVSLGCEGFDRGRLLKGIRESGRPAELLIIQQSGGTRKTIEAGHAILREQLRESRNSPRVPMDMGDLIIGTICGGSDATSGITANPVIGRSFDRLVESGAACIFEETGELIGCEQILSQRATTPELRSELVGRIQKAARYYTTLGHGSFAPGNADGGLTTLEEKSLGAYAKSGESPIVGILTPGDRPPKGGLYLLDVVPDGEVRFGFPNINDNAEIAELIACGSHLTLFSTGRGSVVGSVIAPVIKVCANPETYRRMQDDMDLDAGRILEGRGTLDELGDELVALVADVAAGKETASEALGHHEFVLGYKTFEPLGPACFPA
jgi:altronate dehydratase large subunit